MGSCNGNFKVPPILSVSDVDQHAERVVGFDALGRIVWTHEFSISGTMYAVSSYQLGEEEVGRMRAKVFAQAVNDHLYQLLLLPDAPRVVQWKLAASNKDEQQDVPAVVRGAVEFDFIRFRHVPVRRTWRDKLRRRP